VSSGYGCRDGSTPGYQRSEPRSHSSRYVSHSCGCLVYQRGDLAGRTEQFEAQLIDRVLVRGRSTPIRIYELLARRGQVDERLRPVLEHFARGLRLYLAREWQQAAEEFQHALALGPCRDAPSRLFLTRCRAYSKTPPAEDWNGVSMAGSSIGVETGTEIPQKH
jgi:hypothetical protein